jgi:fructose-bisphosphate aldolase class I
MNKEILINTVSKLVAEPKGILAIDESMPTCDARFEKLGIPKTEEKRRDYRDLLVSAPGIEQYVSGYITFDETIRQSTHDGVTFPNVLKDKGIEVGIKLDEGTKAFNEMGEKVTTGLDNLPTRIPEYKEMGASFAKWRAVINIGDGLPTDEALNANAQALAKYAKICQDNDIVPIVEPEVLIDGTHSMERCYEVTAHNLDILFAELNKEGVYMPGTILKTSMILPGKDSGIVATPEQVAEMTIKCLREHVPADIGGIVFLSGGQSDMDAVLNLNAMKKNTDLPWYLTFSYGRAIQNNALQTWAKNPSDIASAQKALLEAARINSLASVGQYK